ncbi:MAG TPA: V-type ATP synthase subunit E family protein [Anaerolineae bacterium]|nr:V-type ATP synthase subunit E family protein [Anaerolineae bacterium]HQK15240.1 V-type ATP synthase subunit E family protein [Anaerolineae bacterium]
MMGQEKVQVLEQAILGIAAQEAQTILDEAKAKADSIRRQAQNDAQSESERIRQDAQQTAERNIAQAIAKAQLEAQMLRLQRREQVLARVFDKARAQLVTIPQRADYVDLVRRLIGEAATYLGGNNFIVHADATTAQLLDDGFLADLAQKLNVRLERGAPLEAGIGIILSTPDGHRRYDNTLETRLTRIQDDVRTTVYKILTGEAV